MPSGHGKYDREATLVRERTDAEVVVVIVLNGRAGSGFSVQHVSDATVDLPGLLDYLARNIRESTRQEGL